MSFNSPNRRIKRGWMNLKVVEVYEETHDTKTFIFEDADEGGRPFDFIAGQYLTFRYDNLTEKPVVRSYTMSGSPCQLQHTLVTVKRIPGGLVSNWMCDEIKVGDVLRARGPIGRFVYEADKDAPNLFMVAAGSGVTPFTSIIREYATRLTQEGSPATLNLLVAFRSQQDLINWRELKEFGRYPNVNIKVTLTREESAQFWHGRPDHAMLSEFVAGRYNDATFMSCGPQAIMDLTVEHARQMGVDESRIKVESFES